MINLNPKEEKIKVAKDFNLRVITFSFFLLSLMVFTTVIVTVPAYIISFEKKQTIEAELKKQAEEFVPELDQESLKIVKNLDAKLNLIEKLQKKSYPISSNIIDKILLKKMPGIKITQISYQKGEPSEKKINISGIALNREKLLSFRKSFENDPSFKIVDLPISNFIKVQNIQFNLSLVIS